TGGIIGSVPGQRKLVRVRTCIDVENGGNESQEHSRMQRPHAPKSLYRKAPKVGGVAHLSAIAVTQHKPAQHEKEIQEEICVADEGHAGQRIRQHRDEMEDDNQYGTYPSPCIEGLEPRAIWHSEFSPPTGLDRNECGLEIVPARSGECLCRSDVDTSTVRARGIKRRDALRDQHRRALQASVAQ